MICQIVDGEGVVGALHVVRIEACVLLVNLDSSRVQIVERSMAADAYLARRADRSYYKVFEGQQVHRGHPRWQNPIYNSVSNASIDARPRKAGKMSRQSQQLLECHDRRETDS